MMSADRYIFIVGVSRSGTSLMRRILNKSSEVALCEETYFLGHLVRSEGMRYKIRKFGSLKVDDNVKDLIQYMYSPDFENYSRWKTINWQWKWFITEVPQEKMLQRILASDRTDRGVFDVLMTLFAEAQNAAVKGEKTPYHIRYVETLMQWFPQARIIHMMRDPRAIFTSEVRRRKEKSLSPPYKQLAKFDFLLKIFLVAQITWTWSDALKRCRKNREIYDKQYILMKFEDLVGNSDAILKGLCRDLGINLEEQMLAQTVISSGFRSGRKGFDTGASQRWRQHIPRWVDKWFQFVFKKDLEQMGYPV